MLTTYTHTHSIDIKLILQSFKIAQKVLYACSIREKKICFMFTKGVGEYNGGRDCDVVQRDWGHCVWSVSGV